MLFDAAASLTIRLQDADEVLSFEIVIQHDDETTGERVQQLKLESINEFAARLVFKNTGGPFGIDYAFPVGTINAKKLTANFRVSTNGVINKINYSFWGEPEANG